MSQVGAGFCGSARYLLREHGGADAPATGGVEGVLHRDVVIDDDRGDLDPFIRRVLRGELEVQDVAGVVLDDMDDACAAVYSLGGGKHLRRHR